MIRNTVFAIAVVASVTALASSIGMLAAAGSTDPKPGPKQACVWVSECQACTRTSAGKLVCSNIGIACQPKTSRCEPLKK
jgi:hypothetical protein